MFCGRRFKSLKNVMKILCLYAFLTLKCTCFPITQVTLKERNHAEKKMMLENQVEISIVVYGAKGEIKSNSFARCFVKAAIAYHRKS